MINSTNIARWRPGHVTVDGRHAASKRGVAVCSLWCCARPSTSTQSITTAHSNILSRSMGSAGRAATNRSPSWPAGGLLPPFHNSSISGAGTVRSSTRPQLSAIASAAAHTNGTSSSQPLTAVVVGSGMAGLATAAALSDTFEKVTVLEADAPKDSWHQSLSVTEKDPHARPGVGQYQLLHVLLAKGAAEIDRLVPGYINTLLDRGGVKTDFLTEALFATPAGPFVPVHNSKEPLHMVQASRHLLEQTLRDLVSQNPKVSFSYHTRVDGLLFSDAANDTATRPTAAVGAGTAGVDRPASGRHTSSSSSSSSSNGKQRVTGVQLLDGSVLSADLVVVASGRRGEVTKWLSSAAWPEAAVSKTSANCRYVCWLMKMKPEVEAQLPYNGVYYQMQPPHFDTGAYAQQIEDDTWIATIGTFDNKGPKSDMDDILQYMQEVPYVHDAYKLFKQGTVTSDVHTYGRLNNIWHHYEQVLLPDGLLILGDAYCTFNPIYGQGMTVAALEAGIVHSVLEQRRNKAAADPTAASTTSSGSSSYAARVSDLSADFYPAAAEVVGASWLFAALRDLQFPFATAENQELTWNHKMMLAYVDMLCKVATFDHETSEVFCRAIHMLDLPSAMFKPSLVAKALAHKLLGWPWGLVTGQTSKTLPVQDLGMQDLLTSRPRAQV